MYDAQQLVTHGSEIKIMCLGKYIILQEKDYQEFNTWKVCYVQKPIKEDPFLSRLHSCKHQNPFQLHVCY